MSPTKPRKHTLFLPHSNSFLKSLLIYMAALLFLTLISLILFFTLSSATHHRSHHHPTLDGIPPEIHLACKATRFPDTCESSLVQSNHLPQAPNPTQIIQTAIWVFQNGVKEAQSRVQHILDTSSGNLNRSIAAKNCLEALKNSEFRLSSTADAVPRGKIKDARAWMSAALSYNYDTWSGLKYVNDTSLVNETMSFMDSLVHLGSNALSMLRSFDVFGDETGSWAPPRTERDGFWEGVGEGDGSNSGNEGGIPVGLVPDVTVCKDGTCEYKTVQEAVDAAPGTDRFVIRIKEGVYDEIVRVGFEKKNVVFLGDGKGKTVITGSLSVGNPGLSTYNTATVGVLGDGFMASNLTIENTSGPDAHQAVAFRSDSDLSIIENCEFLGNQDTLYVHSLRQFYRSCRIEGNVDFIFGNAASVFQDCQILIRPRQVKPEKGENNAVTAHGRTDPAQSTGLVFRNCLINGTDAYMALYYSKPSVHKNFLGRPWKEYSRTIFISCFLEALITPQGWMPWSGDFALSTLYYGEFDNSGPGANISSRVSWSSRVPVEHVSAYSVQTFIQGDDWIPTSS